MSIHLNSVLAHESVKPTKAQRKDAIMLVYQSVNHALSDREVAERLGYADMNKVRPRITELIEEGKLWELQPIYCPITNRLVRTCTHINNLKH